MNTLRKTLFGWLMALLVLVPAAPAFAAEGNIQETETLVAMLQAQLTLLIQQLAELQTAQAGSTDEYTYQLSIGSRDSSTEGQVKKLQNLLISEGVYPEAINSGYFGNLTKLAVQRLQEKYTLSVTGEFNQSVYSAYKEALEGLVGVNSSEGTLDTFSQLQEKYNEQLKENPLKEGFVKPFRVREGEISDFDEDSHAVFVELWKLFSEILGDKYINLFTEFTIFQNKYDNYAALVEQEVEYRNQKETEEWDLSVNLEYFFLGLDREYNEGVEVLVHEGDDVLTLNDDQITFFVEAEDCKRFYLKGSESCSARVSYYTDYAHFWSDEYLEWTEEYEELNETRSTQDDAAEGLREFYRNNRGDFVSAYAATNIHEDVAETIMYFAIQEKPTSSVDLRDQKVLFFYNYPEMVELRERVQTLMH